MVPPPTPAPSAAPVPAPTSSARLAQPPRPRKEATSSVPTSDFFMMSSVWSGFDLELITAAMRATVGDGLLPPVSAQCEHALFLEHGSAAARPRGPRHDLVGSSRRRRRLVRLRLAGL